MSLLLDLLFLSTGWAHVLLAPYTKVEESFNLHATHDVLFYGLGKDALQHYDHNTFPGAVPRTFIGAILLAYISKPIIFLLQWSGFDLAKTDLQILIRLILSTLNSLTLILIRRRVTRKLGNLSGLFYTLLSITQFHLPFWMGRTLPNSFALIPVNISTALLLSSPRSPKLIITLLTATTVIFRSELLLYLAPISLQLLFTKSLSFWSLIRTGLVASLSSIALTTLVDSYFWSYTLWPELYGIYFNVYLGKSSDWGVSPWHFYLSSALPKLLLSSLPLALFSLFLPSTTSSRSRTSLRPLIIPTLAFIFLISLLGHKEWRFIIYVVPIFNIAAAQSLKYLATRRRGTALGLLSILSVPGFLLVNLLLGGLLLSASIHNYPGGVALSTFNQLYANHTTPIYVHISNHAAQTGASLFLQEHAPPYLSSVSPPSPGWIYDKTENLTLQDLTSNPTITHLISEVSPSELSLLPSAAQSWRLVQPVEAFTGFGLGHARQAARQAIKERRVDLLAEVIRPKMGEVLWTYERV